jgi:hypothetical protein
VVFNVATCEGSASSDAVGTGVILRAGEGSSVTKRQSLGKLGNSNTLGEQS